MKTNDRNHVNIKHTYYCLYFVAFAYIHFKIYFAPGNATQHSTAKLIGIEDVTLAGVDITVLL